MTVKIKRWKILFIVSIVLFNINAQALMKSNSLKSLKVPKQSLYPHTESQIKLYNSPFWYFKNTYDIPVMSFNEIANFILNINKITDKISISRGDFNQFAKKHNLRVAHCLSYDDSNYRAIRCWYDISYKDIKKLVNKEITAYNDYAKQIYDLFMYREKLIFKLLSLMIKFDAKKSLSLVKDINDYYGMSDKKNKQFIDYIMSSIFEITYYNHKNSYNKNNPVIKYWLNKINLYSTISIKNELHILNAVNNMFSVVTYQSDELTWGVEDYHSTPFEMLEKRAGDCEDFAYAKLITLLSLGFNLDDMSLKYVFVDSNGRSVAHMVLVVHSNQGSYVLDNLKKEVYLLKDSNFIDSIYEYNLVRLKVYNEDPYRNYTMIGNLSQFTAWRNKFFGVNY